MVLLAVLVGGLAGCASTGVNVTDQQASAFTAGKSTYRDVTTALGQPTTVTTSADGSKMVLYTYATSQARPESFIPLVGVFVAGANVHANSVAFIFDKDGVLQKHTTSESNYGSGMGLAAGGPSPAVIDQPRDSK